MGGIVGLVGCVPCIYDLRMLVDRQILVLRMFVVLQVELLCLLGATNYLVVL